ncbi:MAG: hypothetical protein QME88_02815 [Actinomycetota bacterium]|nr:hypothetical protein [Actinomycetota bacterium]
MQQSVIGGLRLYYQAAFGTADMVQDQAQRLWKMLLEQNGKMRNELDSITASWMSNLERNREAWQKYLDKNLALFEEQASSGDGGLYAPTRLFKTWLELQAEMMRSWMGTDWMGIWGFPVATAATEAEKEKAERAGEVVSKSK